MSVKLKDKRGVMWMGYAIENSDKVMEAADSGFPWVRSEEGKYASMEMKRVVSETQ